MVEVGVGGRSDLTHSAFVAEQTMAYLREHRHDRFLCIAGFYSPHSPWVAPQEYIDLYDPEALTLPTFPPEIDARRSETAYSDRELRAAGLEMDGWFTDEAGRFALSLSKKI